MGATDLDNDPGATPVRFAEKVLGLSLYPWQERALMSIALASGRCAPLILGVPCRRTKTTVSAPNGAGKDDRVIATAALWWVYKHPRGTAVITTTSAIQLDSQTIPAIERHRMKFQNWTSVKAPRYEMRTPTGGSIVGFVTNDAQNVEGWHKKDDVDGPLLYIVNEAKGFKEDKFERIDRCGFNALMYISSPGAKMGRFYDSHAGLSAQFHTIMAGYTDCPHIPKEKHDDLIAMYGINHPVVRSTLYGEFMSQDEMDRYVCDVDSYIRCLDNPPTHRPGMRVGFCDFGAGMAEHVFGIRDGNKIDVVAAWREPSDDAAAGRFIREFVASGLRPDQIHGDAAGKDILDLLAKAGWPINRQGFGEKAYNSDLYPSWVAESWQEGAAGIKRCEWILPPQDKVLRAQVINRQKHINNKGKLCLEEKHDLEKRGVKSPDRADVVFGLMAVRDYSHLTRTTNINMREWREANEPAEDAGVLEAIGAGAGW